MEFRFAPAVCDRFPDLFASILVVRGWDNTVTGAAAGEILDVLRESERGLRERVASKSDLQNDVLVSSYFDMFRSFGVNPKRVKPSHYALAERVVAGGSLPDINPAVNLYNAFSVGHLVPFGGEDLDRVDTCFELTIADGTEPWTPIGSDAPQTTRAGDVVWRDRSDVSTTSLNHRQCEKTKLTPQSRNAYFISEGFRGVNDAHVAEVAGLFRSAFGDLLGGRFEQFVISSDAPSASTSGGL
ncbi:B3/4 domain-containing protein [Streptomyces sp. NPDC020983]|uniref:B3/4 domain-containing protein n=1 Tax=Streptomyces sp. NPDC020983 TaxID=3365106 RepID=UPI00379341EA